MDGADDLNFFTPGPFDHFYAKRRGGAVHLRFILSMKRILKRLNKYARGGINILVRLFLGLVYLILLFPFAAIIRLRTDYLGTKTGSSGWIPLEEIPDQKELLRHQ